MSHTERIKLLVLIQHSVPVLVQAVQAHGRSTCVQSQSRHSSTGLRHAQGYLNWLRGPRSHSTWSMRCLPSLWRTDKPQYFPLHYE